MLKNIKRTIRVIKGMGKYVIISVIMLILVQLLEFVSPLLVKEVLDEYIEGISYDWVEIAKNENTDKYVIYNDHQYKQVRFLNDNDVVIGDFSLIIYKGKYYVVDERIESGTNTIEGDTLTVKQGPYTYTYQATKLSKDDVYNFYSPSFKTLIILIILLFLRSATSIICSFIQRKCNNEVIATIGVKGRLLALEAVERLPICYFDEEPAGKMASRISYDVDGMITIYRSFTNVILSGVFSFFFAYLGMFILDPKLALYTFLIYPLVYVWVRLYLGKLKKIAERVNENRSLLTAKINEIINGINILQVFNFKDQTIKEFNKINQEYIDDQLKEVKLHLTLGWNLINVIRGVITVVIVLYFGSLKLSLNGTLVTAGLIYAYNEYLLKITNPISIIFNQVSAVEHAMVQTERIHKLIEGDLEDDTINKIEKYKGDIKFNHVKFAYVNDDYVLKDVSFHILPGESVGLVGATGAGKSSLMNLLLRFYDIKDGNGEILVDDVNIKTNPKRTYREHIGIVLQEPVLFKGTIASNIRFGKDDVTDKEVEDILISLGGKRIIDKFPNGINQEISRAGVNMSSGEKQIIALARALVYNPSILIMDEATSHIDTETEMMIKQALEVVKKNRTMIIIAHRLSTIQNCDKIIVLDHGQKVEEGNHHELIQKNGTYASIYRAQVVNIK